MAVRSATDGYLTESRRMSHGAQLARSAHKHPDRVAFVCRDEQRTFADVDRNVDQLASALATRGVSAGDRVAVLMGNSIEMVEAIFAGWRLGAIVVPVNFRLVADEIGFVLGDSGAGLLIVDERLAAAVGELRASLPTLQTVLVSGGSTAAAGSGAETLDEAIGGTTDKPLSVDVDEHEPALIIYTSGTTGRPKGAVLSHFNLLMHTFSTMVTQGIRGDDEVWYGNLPLFHAGGLTGILPYVLTGGRSIIVPSGNFDAGGAVDDLERHGITGCVFIGMQWNDVCDHIAARNPTLRLRRVSWGAANTPLPVLEKMSRVLSDVEIYSFFGQTEMTATTCVLEAADAERKRGSVGRPIVNIEARVVDDDGRDVAAGEVGEIVYRAPTAMLGYWNRPDATAEAFRGGWFHSGDLCRVDDEGFVYVVDRKTDMIISGGENIYCPELEAVIVTCPGVAEVAVIGVAHEKWGETPLAVVVATDPAAPPTADDVIEWCRQRLAPYKKPTAVVVVDALPRNAAGKVTKPVLRATYRVAQQGVP